MVNEDKQSNLPGLQTQSPSDSLVDPAVVQEERKGWRTKTLAGLTESSTTSVSKVNRGTVDATEEVITCIERMFKTFVDQAYERNERTRGSRLELSWDLPIVKDEVTEDWLRGTQKKSVLVGRLNTREWTLIARGLNNEVIIHILPADKLFAFAASTQGFNPFVRLISQINNDSSFSFKIGTVDLRPEMEAGFFERLIDSLERFARNQGHFNQPASITSLGLKAVTPKAPQVDKDLERRRWEEEFFQDMQDVVPTVPPYNQELPSYLSQSQNQDTGSISEWARQIKDGTDLEAKLELNDGRGSKTFFEESIKFSDGLEDFLNDLEDEIRRVEKASSEAIKAQDWSEAEGLFRLVGFLKSVRSESYVLTEEYERLANKEKTGTVANTGF